MKKINCLILFLLFFSVILIPVKGIEWGTMYSLEIEIFKNDEVVLKEITATNTTISHFPSTETGYSIKVLSSDNKELFKENLGVSFTILIGERTFQRNSTTINIRIPYHPTAKYIAVYHEDKKIFETDLNKQFCNKDSICDLGENQYNCPDDCIIKKGFSAWFYVFIVIAIISTIAFLILFKLKPKSQTFSNLYQKWK